MASWRDAMDSDKARKTIRIMSIPEEKNAKVSGLFGRWEDHRGVDELKRHSNLKRSIFDLYSLLFFPGFLGVLLFAWLSQILIADSIYLKNGKRVEADRSWSEGNQICYEKDGNIFRFPQSLVEKVEKSAASPSLAGREVESPNGRNSWPELDKIPSSLHFTSDKGLALKTGIIQNGKINQKELMDLASACRNQPSDPSLQHRYLVSLTEVIEFQVQQGDQNGAMDNLQRFLELEKNHLPAALILASLYLKQGQYAQAENLLAQFQIKNSRSAELHYLLGATYYYEEKNGLAGQELRLSLQLAFNPDVQILLRKIE
jgi:tetratricopeptide (TPR) repeat protein